jgi:hypothetical protein
MENMIDQGATPITGNFEISLPAPDGASLRITGYVYANEAAQSLNERMDICREALRRQQRKLEVPAVEKTVEAMSSQIQHFKNAYADLLEKKAGKLKLTSQELTALENYPKQISHMEKEIEKGRATIEKAMSKD